MVHSQSIPVHEREYYEIGRNQSYTDWVKELRKKMKLGMLLTKEYSQVEKNALIENFIEEHVKNHLRKYIGTEGNYSYHMRRIKQSLMRCFPRKSQVVMQIEKGKMNTLRLLCEENYQNNYELIAPGEQID